VKNLEAVVRVSSSFTALRMTLRFDETFSSPASPFPRQQQKVSPDLHFPYKAYAFLPKTY